METGDHGVHDVGALQHVSTFLPLQISVSCGATYLLVAQPGEPVLGSSKKLPLIDTTELSIDLEVLLIEHLEDRVEETGQRSVVGLLDNLSTSLLGVVLGNESRELVDIHDVVGALLVGAAEDELELVGRDTDGLQESGDGALIVLGAEADELDGRLEVVEDGMDVGEENDDMAAGGEQLGDLDGGN